MTALIIGASKPEHLEDAVTALSLKLAAALEGPYILHAVAGFT